MANCLSKKSFPKGVDKQPLLWYSIIRKGKVINMKEQMIKYWKRKERAITNEASL